LNVSTFENMTGGVFLHASAYSGHWNISLFCSTMTAGKLSKLNRYQQSNEGTFCALGMAGIEHWLLCAMFVTRMDATTSAGPALRIGT
jgi:hypothetical protein